MISEPSFTPLPQAAGMLPSLFPTTPIFSLHRPTAAFFSLHPWRDCFTAFAVPHVLVCAQCPPGFHPLRPKRPYVARGRPILDGFASRPRPDRISGPRALHGVPGSGRADGRPEPYLVSVDTPPRPSSDWGMGAPAFTRAARCRTRYALGRPARPRLAQRRVTFGHP
jgi:hypothetical protein